MKLYNIACNNLRRRKVKVLFLVAGLLIGIATIVTLVAVTETMTSSIEERLDRFGANIVMVPKSDNLSLSYGGVSVGGVSYEVKDFAEADIAKVHQIEAKRNLGAVAPKVLGATQVKGKHVLLMGVDFAVEIPLKTWWQVQGKIPESANELLLGAEAAATLGFVQGDTFQLGDQPYLVSALLAPTGNPEDAAIIGPLHSIQQVLGKQGRVTMVEIAAFCRDCPITEMVLQIAEQFPDAKVTALKQAVMAKMQSIELFKTFSYAISCLVIFIGSLLVFVTMMGSVNERTREIGIFRAIGFRQGHIMHIILLEALLVGIVGGVAGFAVGNGAAGLLMPLILPEAPFHGINIKVGALAIVLSVALSLLASYYPAKKGSSLDPSAALRAL